MAREEALKRIEHLLDDALLQATSADRIWESEAQELAEKVLTIAQQIESH